MQMECMINKKIDDGEVILKAMLTAGDTKIDIYGKVTTPASSHVF